MLIIENDEFVDCNSAAVAILGYDNKEEIINKPPFMLSPEFQPNGCLSVDKASEMIRVAKELGGHRFEWDHLRKDGTIIPVEVSLTAIRSDGEIHLHTIWRDISIRKKAEKTLNESEERFRHTFETNPDTVILTRLEDGAIIDVNKTFVEVTGISRLQALGHNSEQLNLWRNNELRESFREQLQAQGEIRNFAADFKVKGDQTRTGLLSACIINIKDEPCILLTIRDITTEKAAERTLIEMDQLKSDFISTAAHELRTPLTAIIGFTELLLDPVNSINLTEDLKREFLREIYERGETLDRMINDFLDVSRIESGLPLPLALHETNLAEVLNKVIEFYHLLERDYSFQLVLPEEPSLLSVIIDRQRINQVLENLLSNAVKYSPKGKKVILSGRPVPNGWEISVTDHGIGMSQEQLSKVFDKFYRAKPTDAKAQGLGLGMSIVRHIVEAHGGSIRVESTEGEGTTVTFNLPSSTT